MTFYELLVFIHVFSAILGMGPGFVMTFVVTHSNPSNMTELRQSFTIRNKLHILTMVGGTVLLITGIWMGFLNTYWFSQGWYLASLFLFLVALALGPTLLKSRSKPIKKLLRENKREKIPEEYNQLSKRLFFVEHVENIIFLFIIALMILKPF